MADSPPLDATPPPQRWHRRLWGLDPRAVEAWADDVWQRHLREVTPVLTELGTLRRALAASETAVREADGRAATAEARVAQLEAQHEDRERRAREMRDEALAAVAEAWARAQEIEARAREVEARAQAAWQEEEVRQQRARTRAIEEWQAALAGLRGQQLQAIDGAKTLARDLLDFAEALRARVLDDDAPEAAIPPLAFYWQEQSGADPAPAADAPDRAR